MPGFDAIPEDKRQRLIDAALLEFSTRGYTRASTNTIVAQAAIAKGLLFHYLGSKKQLYLALYRYCMGVILDDLFRCLDIQQQDVIERLRQIQANKLALIGRHPNLFDFIKSAYLEQNPVVAGEIKAHNEALAAAQARIYDNLDFTRFREGIDPKHALQVITWTMEGYVNKLLAQARLNHSKLDYQKAFEEMNAYLDLLQLGLYCQ